MMARSTIGIAFALALLAPEAHAQSSPVRTLRDELARIRDAATLEARGDFAGAEKVLQGVLAGSPQSLSALLGLERLYLVQGKLDSLVPHVNRLLQRDPVSAIGHQMLVRTWAALDRPDELERAGKRWIAATPKLETPYREIARTWRQRREPQRALAVLEHGRDRIGTPGALALELGDTWLELGDLRRAVTEWDRAIGRDGQGFMLVQRRVRALPDGGAAVAPLLLRALAKPPASVARQRGALQLALDAGLSADAERIARPLLAQLPPKEREPFLADVARRADGAALAGIAYWAYGELIRSAEADTVRLLALRTRQAQLALELGDTARAAAAWSELEQATAPGSPQRRQAMAVRIRLLAREGKARAAVPELDAFRAEYPGAPELDETASTVAEAVLEHGDLDTAERLLLGVRGARSSLARGRTYLRRGDAPRARAEFMAAAPALHGPEATRAIALATALSRIAPETGELLGRAVSRAREDAPGAVRELVEKSHGLPGRERAAILDFAASLADDAALPEVAEEARRELVSEHPKSDVAPAALLWLAQRAAADAEQQEAARVLLEKLILEYPRSALVPHARRELDLITGRVPAPQPGRKAGES